MSNGLIFQHVYSVDGIRSWKAAFLQCAKCEIRYTLTNEQVSCSSHML